MDCRDGGVSYHCFAKVPAVRLHVIDWETAVAGTRVPFTLLLGMCDDSAALSAVRVIWGRKIESFLYCIEKQICRTHVGPDPEC